MDRPRPLDLEIGYTPLSEDAIHDTASVIRRALSRPPPDDQSAWIPARGAQLPGADEQPVTVGSRRLHAAATAAH